MVFSVLVYADKIQWWKNQAKFAQFSFAFHVCCFQVCQMVAEFELSPYYVIM